MAFLLQKEHMMLANDCQNANKASKNLEHPLQAGKLVLCEIHRSYSLNKDESGNDGIPRELQCATPDCAASEKEYIRLKRQWFEKRKMLKRHFARAAVIKCDILKTMNLIFQADPKMQYFIHDLARDTNERNASECCRKIVSVGRAHKERLEKLRFDVTLLDQLEMLANQIDALTE